MRIHGPDSIIEKDPAEGPKARSASSAQASEAKSSSSTETVVLSKEASQAQETAEKAELAHAERLALVKSQIQLGTYKVDKDKLAKLIVEEELARARKP
jgi:flagellar biosynthesis anti-sigma factor FlgM